MAYGMSGHIGISAQQSFGTATTSWDYFPIISETLTTNIEQLVEEGMKGVFDEGDSHAGLISVAGDIVFEPHPIMVGHFLRGVTNVASISEVASAVYLSEFVPQNTDFDDTGALPPFTIQVYRGVGSAWQFTDSIITGLTINITGGGIAKATANVMSRVSSLMEKSTPAYPTGDPWLWNTASLSIAGTANGNFENVSISIENPIEGKNFLDTTRMYSKFKRTGYRQIRMTGTMDFESQTQYGIFRAQTEQRFLVGLTGSSLITSANALVLDLPKLRYTSYPVNIGGPGPISVGFEGHAKTDSSSSYAFRATLTNTRATLAN